MLDGGSMFGVIPRTLWSRMVEPDEMNRYRMQTNCLLLERDGTRVLVESGFGDKWTPREREIYCFQDRTVRDALAEIDVDPASIDHVFLSHMHFDHAGGTTHAEDGGDVVPSFPNARIHVQDREWQDARDNRTTMSGTFRPENMDPIRDQLVLADGECEPVQGIRVMPVPGHTWGQQAILFEDSDGTLCFPGDLVPDVHHFHPSASMGFDMLPWDNMVTKKALFKQAMDGDWRLVLAHEMGPAVVTVQADPDHPGRCLPVAWQPAGDGSATCGG